MRHAIAVFAFCLLILQTQTAGAATPLVDAAWMKANAGTPGLVVLDIRNRNHLGIRLRGWCSTAL